MQDMCGADSLTDTHAVRIRAVLRQLLAALGFLHSHRVVHRDVKPENIMLQSVDPERIVLIDFGIAKDLDRRMATTTAFVRPGMRDPAAMGTLGYLPPESFAENSPPLRPAASMDMFAVGLIALEAATGERWWWDSDVGRLAPLQLPASPGALRRGNALATLQETQPRRCDGGSAAAALAALLHLGAKLTATAPEQRPTAESAALHPFFTGGDGDGSNRAAPPLVSKLTALVAAQAGFQAERERAGGEAVEVDICLAGDGFAASLLAKAAAMPIGDVVRPWRVVDAGAGAAAQAAAGAEDDFAADEPAAATLSLALRTAFALLAAAEDGVFERGGDAGLLLPAGGGGGGAARGAGRLLGKALVEGVDVSLPLAPTAVAALLGRLRGGASGRGVLGGAATALEHLRAWDPAACRALWGVLLGDSSPAALAAAGVPAAADLHGAGRPAAVASAAAERLLGGGRGVALEALGAGFQEVRPKSCPRTVRASYSSLCHLLASPRDGRSRLQVVRQAGLESALSVLDESALSALFLGAAQLAGGEAILERLDWAADWPAADPQRRLLPALLARLEPPAARLLLARCTGAVVPPPGARILVRRATALGAAARAAVGVLELPAECDGGAEQLEVSHWIGAGLWTSFRLTFV